MFSILTGFVKAKKNGKDVGVGVNDFIVHVILKIYNVASDSRHWTSNNIRFDFTIFLCKNW